MPPEKPSLREIFADAAELADPTQRATFLNSACKGDATLRRRVERLLAADEHSGNFLRHPDDTTRSELTREKIGERIGRYRLVELIGRGGGGVVYRAEQEEPVRRQVALKILKLGMDTESVVARFEAERQALAVMDHPNIARVLDAGATEKGRPFFVMELVSGPRLSDYCERHQLSLQQRLDLFIQVCRAVQHAHQKGVIHRDLKPSNILVAEHEGVPVPKVIDFGIAKATEQPSDGNGGLTSMNLFLGTPAYMSPEQVEFGGRDVDTRTDIYSLGVILYELLAGHPPFDPKELAAAGLDEMRRIIREVDPPRPSTTITRNLNPARLPSTRPVARERLAAIKGDLDWIVMKCLAKDRTRRYETANGLAMDLRRHLDHEPVVARPPNPVYHLQKIVRRHSLLFGAAGVVTLVLVAAVIISAQLALRARHAEQAQARMRQLAETSNAESRERLIRRYVAEGNRLLEEARPATALSWLVEALQLETGDPQREADERLRIAQALVGAPELRLHLAQGKSVNAIALSPDGSHAATGSDDGSIRLSDLNNNRAIVRKLIMPSDVRRVAFSPDGARVVAVTAAGQARLWNAASGEALSPLLVADDFSEQSVADVRYLRPAASFSADGKFVLLAWGSKFAQLRDSSTGSLLRQFSHSDVVYHAAFSSDGRYVVTSSKDGTARVWATASGTSAGPRLEHAGSVEWAQFSLDSTKLLTVRDRHYVQLWDWREGRKIAPEIPRRANLSHASLSLDGSNILTTASSGYAHVYDAASSRLMYEFQEQGGILDAAISPDGRHLATACEDGNAWIWDGAEATSHPMLLPHGSRIEQIAFSANGRYLAVAGRGGQARMWDLFPPQRGVRRLPGNDVAWVEFDQSGRRALVLSTGPKSSLRVYDTSTCGLVCTAKLSPGEATQARFSPDGSRVLTFGTGRTARVFDADLGKEVFTLAHPHSLHDALWSPDGKLIVTAASAAGAVVWSAATGQIAKTYSASNSVIAIALSPDGSRLAIGEANNTVRISDTARLVGDDVRSPLSGTQVPRGPLTSSPARASGQIRQLAFSPDGKRFGICSTHDTEGIVEIRDAASGALISPPLVHRDFVRAFDFSPDGRWIATACDDHAARVWDVISGGPVSPWLLHDYEAREVVFSHDSARIATQARRGAARLWNASTGEPITTPLIYSRNVGTGRISYSPDGRRLLIASGGNEAWLRELEPTTASVEQLRLLAQVLSCTRFDPASGMVPMDEPSLADAWNKLCALRQARLVADSR
ncbi:MAG: hypothetical protein C5B50_00255 [Verrucomicrobia bacterium]|nr:MAG: hypothetical protein C5B50_00255 [Verrucomicrobiota bacterium]